MGFTIQTRNDLAANWTSVNPVLSQGEAGYETDTQRIKYGDGVTAWTSLAYFNAGGGGGSVSGVSSFNTRSGSVTLLGADIAAAGGLRSTNNLSDLTNAGTSRSNIHVGILGACQTVATASVATLNPTNGPWSGASVTLGGQILLTAQNNGAENGPWIFNGPSLSLTRPTDYATNASVGSRVIQVSAGNYANTEWMMSNTSSIIVDTTATTWAPAYANVFVPSGTGSSVTAITIPTNPTATDTSQQPANDAFVWNALTAATTTASIVLFGSGAPSSGIGQNGDGYIDYASGNCYGPKAAGAWPGSPFGTIT